MARLGQSALLFGAVAGLFLVLATSGGRPPSGEASNAASDRSEGSIQREPPLVDGEQVTLTEAKERLPFSVHLPDDPLADASLISEVWLDDSDADPRVAIVYSSGIRVVLSRYEPPNDVDMSDPRAIAEAEDSATTFEERVGRVAAQHAEFRGVAASEFMTTVNGKKAIVFSPSEYGGGYLAFQLPDGVVVSIYGDVQGSELVRVAESVK